MPQLSRRERLRRALELPNLQPAELPRPPRMASQSDVGVPALEGEPDLLEDLRQPFVAWFDSSLRLDLRWSTSEHALYADFCAWMFERDLAPPTSGQFLLLLRELCCSIRVNGTEQFVDYVGLKDDIEAHEWFQQHPEPDPHPPAPEPMPEPPQLWIPLNDEIETK